MSFCDCENILKKYCYNKKIAVAVSGGADSMALLHFVLHSDFINKKNLVVVNVNHNIRAETSDRDSSFVKAKCAEFELSFAAFSVDVLSKRAVSGRSVELEAREARRDVFAQVVKTGVADVVLVAHHASDNAETILMRVLRGTGIKGLCGMKIYSENSCVLRPFLSVSKQEILDYVKQNKIEYVTDESNFDDSYDRNFIRLKLMPLIKTRWQKAENAINRLGVLANESCEIVDGLIDESNFILDNDFIKIRIDALKNKSLASAYVVVAIKKLGVSEDVYSKNIQEVVDLVFLENGARVCVGQGYIAYKEYDYICIGHNGKAKKSNIEQPVIIGENMFDGQKIFFKTINSLQAKTYMQNLKQGDKSALLFDLSKLPNGARIRYRQEGDVFSAFGSGEKKLKEFLINKKIPSRLRDKIPLVCYNKQVLIICGVEISSCVSCAENSQFCVVYGSFINNF